MTLPTRIDEAKLKAANEALSLFAKETTIEFQPGRGIVVSWISATGRSYSRRWQVMPNDAEARPCWYKDWPHGNTAKSALVQLVLWLKGRPVLRLSVWRYWESYPFLLGSGMGEILEAAGYPKDDTCLTCKRSMQPGLDWCGRGGKRGAKCISAVQSIPGVDEV